MGLVLDSSVLIAAERDAKSVSEVLAALEQQHGQTEVVLSSITVIELEHGLHRANSPEIAHRRRDYLGAVFAAIPVESFISEPIIRSDPKDDPVLFTAVQGLADVLCTRDRDFYAPEVIAFCRQRGIEVMNELELLRLLRDQLSR